MTIICHLLTWGEDDEVTGSITPENDFPAVYPERTSHVMYMKFCGQTEGIMQSNLVVLAFSIRFSFFSFFTFNFLLNVFLGL